jgi:hypothetical protein
VVKDLDVLAEPPPIPALQTISLRRPHLLTPDHPDSPRNVAPTLEGAAEPS